MVCGSNIMAVETGNKNDPAPCREFFFVFFASFSHSESGCGVVSVVFCLFVRSRVLKRCLVICWSILGWFWDCLAFFPTNVCFTIFKNGDFVKMFSHRKTDIVVRFPNLQKLPKMIARVWKMEKLKIGYGWIWNLIWKGLGAIRELSQAPIGAKHWNNMVSKRPLGSILDEFLEAHGKVCAGTSRNWTNSKDLGQSLWWGSLCWSAKRH